MKALLSTSSLRLIGQFNNASVEKAAIDSMQRLIRHHTKLGESDPEAVSLGVIQHLKTFPFAPSQPNAVFNSGGNENLDRRERYLLTNSRTSYGDWDLPSTHWISKTFTGGDADARSLRLSLFNLNSALMAQSAAQEHKNAITFTEGLSVIKSPNSIFARSELPAMFYEALKNPDTNQSTIIGLPITKLTKELGQEHAENPHVIFPMSHAFGVIVGDGTRLSPRVLEDHDFTVKLRDPRTSSLEPVSLAHFKADSAQKFYFSFQPIQQTQTIPTASTSAQWQPPSTTPTQPVTATATPITQGGTPGPQTSTLGAASTQTTISMPNPTPERLINDRAHPDNALYRQALSAVQQLDTQQGRKSDVHSEQLAAVLTVAAHRDGLKQIDHVQLSPDSKHAFAIEGDPKTLSHRQTAVATLDALNTSIEKSSQTLAQEKSAGAQGRPAPDDPRHSAHPAHAEFQNVRQLVTELHAKHGVPSSEEQRDRLAAAVIHDAHNNQLGSVKELRFSEDKAGKIQPDGHVFAFNGDPRKETTLHSATHVPLAQETPVTQSFKQMANATQQPQQQQQKPQPQPPQGSGQVTGGGHPGGR